MHFELSDELKALVQIVREFAAEKITPFVKEWDEAHHFPYREVVRPMAELGFLGTVIPEEYGGNNMGWLAAAIIMNTLPIIVPVTARWISSIIHVGRTRN